MTSIEPAATTPTAPPPGARFAGVLRRVRAWVLKVAIAAALAAAVIVYAIVDDGFPSGGMAVLAVIGIIAAVAPPLMLAAFWVALGELAKLPERLRRLPMDASDHGAQIRALLDQSWSAAPRNRFHLPRVLWRLTRLTLSARETLTPYAPLAPLLSVPFLAATAGAVVLAGIEIVVACVVAIVLLAGG